MSVLVKTQGTHYHNRTDCSRVSGNSHNIAATSEKVMTTKRTVDNNQKKSRERARAQNANNHNDNKKGQRNSVKNNSYNYTATIMSTITLAEMVRDTVVQALPTLGRDDQNPAGTLLNL